LQGTKGIAGWLMRKQQLLSRHVLKFDDLFAELELPTGA
jgi:hypothetical protein